MKPESPVTGYPGFPYNIIFLPGYAAKPNFQQNIKLVVQVQTFRLLKKI